MGTIHGRVVDADGHGVPEAAVFVVSSPASVPDLALLSDADGAFVLPSVNRVGTYRVGASVGGLRGEAEVILGARDDSPAVLIELGAQPP